MRALNYVSRVGLNLSARILEAASQGRLVPAHTSRILTTARHASGLLEAHLLSPNRSLRGLARESLGIEDPNIEIGKISVAVDYLQRRLEGKKPEVILTLGSGLGDLVSKIENPIIIPYSEIPCFPRPKEKIEGHAGNLVVGRLGGKTVATMQGRFHPYQGLTAREIVRPLRTLVTLGGKYFIVTNAAGGINPNFKIGDFMLIKDDYNLSGMNPLVGPNLPEFGPQFPDMSSAYTPELRELARKIAEQQGIPQHIQEGVYGCNLGPNYERPFEIKVLAQLKADAAGMSTALEVLAANHFNAGKETPRVKILGITLITNLAAGISKTPLNHAEVKEAGDEAAVRFEPFVEQIISELN